MPSRKPLPTVIGMTECLSHVDAIFLLRQLLSSVDEILDCWDENDLDENDAASALIDNATLESLNYLRLFLDGVFEQPTSSTKGNPS